MRHPIAGGLAVVAHGLVRFTADLDLILDPDPGALARAIAALQHPRDLQDIAGLESLAGGDDVR